MPIPWPNGDNSKIEYQQENPKSVGSSSFERYEKYKVSKTLREAKQNGAGSIDFAHDYKKGFLKILADDVAAASTTAEQPASSAAKAKATAKTSTAASSKRPVPEHGISDKAVAADASEKSTGNNQKKLGEPKAAASGSKRKLSAADVAPAAVSATASATAPQQLDIKGCWIFLPSMRSHAVEFRDTGAVEQAEEDKNAKSSTVAASSGNDKVQAEANRSKKPRTVVARSGTGKDRQRKMLGLRSKRNGEEEKKEKKHKKHKKHKKDKKSKKEKKHKKEKKDKTQKRESHEPDEEKGTLAEKKKKNCTSARISSMALPRKRGRSAAGSGTSTAGSKNEAIPVTTAKAGAKAATEPKAAAEAATSATKASSAAAVASSLAKASAAGAAKASHSAATAAKMSAAVSAPPLASPPAAKAASTAKAQPASAKKSSPPPKPEAKAGAASDLQDLQRMINALDETSFGLVLDFLRAEVKAKGAEDDTFELHMNDLSKEKLEQLTRIVNRLHGNAGKAVSSGSSSSSSTVPKAPSPKAELTAAAQRHREATHSQQAHMRPAASPVQVAPLQQVPPRPALHPGMPPPVRPGPGHLSDASAMRPPLPSSSGPRSAAIRPVPGHIQPVTQQTLLPLQAGQLPPGYGHNRPSPRQAAPPFQPSSWDSQAHAPGLPPMGPRQLHPCGYEQLHAGWSGSSTGQSAHSVDALHLHPGYENIAQPNHPAGMFMDQRSSYLSGNSSNADSDDELPYFGDGGGWAPGGGPTSAHQAPRILPGDTNPPGPCNSECNCAQSAGVQLRQGVEKPWLDEAHRRQALLSFQSFANHPGVIKRGAVSRQHRFQPAAPGWHERQEAQRRVSQNTAAPIVVATDDGTPPRQRG